MDRESIGVTDDLPINLDLEGRSHAGQIASAQENPDQADQAIQEPLHPRCANGE
jgi:hypothetical protein